MMLSFLSMHMHMGSLAATVRYGQHVVCTAVPYTNEVLLRFKKTAFGGNCHASQ